MRGGGVFAARLVGVTHFSGSAAVEVVGFTHRADGSALDGGFHPPYGRFRRGGVGCPQPTGGSAVGLTAPMPRGAAWGQSYQAASAAMRSALAITSSMPPTM
ncbi:hypothetical protein MACH21_23050 [Roseicyclus marinus]|uniref:Uncharacterized protein n=1 Tax=Roseicyclus marinus TaxID=2161673 RepID=A0AA48KKQ7_9RHOB|nr:hypothetical protein MACH21_23050 [Roseicyclus marinus]